MTEEKPISGWRAREISGIMVPSNEEVEIGEVATKRLHDWLVGADIDFPERVHGANSRPHDFVMVIDDEGRDRGLPWNPRAQFLSGYPIVHPICGDALFWSEGFGDEGMDFQSLGATAQRWLRDPIRGEEYIEWRHQPQVIDFAHEYIKRYPQKPPLYTKRNAD